MMNSPGTGWRAVYETGVDRGVLYLPDETGDYNEGHAWNGLTTVTESPSAPSPTRSTRTTSSTSTSSRPRSSVHDRGLHLPGRVRSVRWHRRARAGYLPDRPAEPSHFGLCYPHQARQRSGRYRSRLQAPSGLRRSRGSVGEGLRLDQRFA
jgi:hypothetical protein